MMTAQELQLILQAINSQILVVEERHLNRLIKRRIDTGYSHATATDMVHRFDPKELRTDEFFEDLIPANATQHFLLVIDPEDWHVEELPKDLLLRRYWRMLVSFDLEQHLAAKNAAPTDKDQKILNEAKFVLEQDRRIPENANDEFTWRKYLAIAATRESFEPETVEYFYPTLKKQKSENTSAIQRVLKYCSVAEIIKKWKPADSASQIPEHKSKSTDEPSLPQGRLSGNLVRNAVIQFQGKEYEAAKASLNEITKKLTPILLWSDQAAEKAGETLFPLLRVADDGKWPHAARLLYDLQTIGLDFQGEVYRVDLPGSIYSFGKKSVQRKIPHAKEIQIALKLKTVEKHLNKSHLSFDEEHAIRSWLSREILNSEQRTRNEIKPVIKKALHQAGITASQATEHVAEEAICNELVDKICERGFFRYGDLRDSIAKFDLKIPDISGVKEFFQGDALLRCDRQLRDELDGVYHPAELYLRWFQRISSIGFGNRAGRFATKFLILPFLGAFLTLEFLQHVIHGMVGLRKYFSKVLAPKVNQDPGQSQSANNKQPELPLQPDKEPKTEVNKDLVKEPKQPNKDPNAIIEPANQNNQPATPESPPMHEVVQPQNKTNVFDIFNEPVNLNPEEAIKNIKEIATSRAGGESHSFELVSWPSVVILGLLILGVLHIPVFRGILWKLCILFWKLIRSVVYDLPILIWNSRIARAIRNNNVSRFLYRRFSTGIALTSILIVTMYFLGAESARILRWMLYSFIVTTLFSNTRMGRWLEDKTASAISNSWRKIFINLIPGLIGWFAWAFRELLGWVERILYSVDEWFRFRGSQSKSGYFFKAILGLIWFPIAYIIRFAFYLLIEPQVNPIKHFPVVTVSHKVLFTSIPLFRDKLGINEAFVVGVITCIPGIFGFLAWEFKENWRLYRANRAKKLNTLSIGHHGESVLSFLRPGFHSGTIPKLHRKIRAAIRKSEYKNTDYDFHKFEHERRHAERSVANLIDRHGLEPLRKDSNWGNLPISVKTVSTTVLAFHADIDCNGTILAIEWNLDGNQIHQKASGFDQLNLSEMQMQMLAKSLDGLQVFAGCENSVSKQEWDQFWNKLPANIEATAISEQPTPQEKKT